MAKPTHRVTKIDGETGRKSTVSRHTSGDRAEAARITARGRATKGSSDTFGSAEIRRRK